MPGLARLDENMRNLLTFLVGALAAMSGTFAGQARAATPKDVVKAELLADVASVKAGQPFTVGVLLKMKPHWHVYWKNPGDSGLPTEVTWKLPEGFKAGELKFPIPVRFDQPGDVKGFGYNDEVLLTAEVTPPNNLPSDKPIEIGADVEWLVCEKVCIPGKAKLSLSLPASADASPANAELFATWKERTPSASKAPTDVTKNADGATTVNYPTPAGAKDVQWFALPPQGSGIEDVQTKTEANVSAMTFNLVPAPKQAAEMQFLVAYTDLNGKRQGVEFNVKLPPPAK
jgi:DsbC/DsbD-like thiol-disulfide interchange protein